MAEKNTMKHIFCMVVFVSLLGVRAADSLAQSDDFITKLTEKNVADFLKETNSVSLGYRDDMAMDDVQKYLNRHLAPKSNFHSKTTFEIPGYPAQETEIEVKKKDYITNILDGKGLISNYQADLEIKKIKIAGTGRSATVTTTSHDSGELPWPDAQGNERMVPIRGVSECEQKLTLSLSNYVQILNASCSTTIKFLPFGNTPLGE